MELNVRTWTMGQRQAIPVDGGRVDRYRHRRQEEVAILRVSSSIQAGPELEEAAARPRSGPGCSPA